MESKLIEIAHIGTATAGILDIPAKFWPGPGQYLPCQLDADPLNLLPNNLFRVIGPDDRLYLGPLPENWLPGDRIRYLSPQGNGFSLPSTARRVGLLAFNVPPLRILTLLKAALLQNAALVLFWDAQPNQDILHLLPTMVEVAPTTSLVDNLDWLDYLAVDLELANLTQLRSLLGAHEPSFTGQVLLHTDMPCRGVGDCGVCAVKTRKGWRLACIDGPVFDLQELFNVA
jgi:NAD(P)H-flavin reductase